MREPLYTDLKTPSYPSYDIEAINNSIRNILTTSKLLTCYQRKHFRFAKFRMYAIPK